MSLRLPLRTVLHPACVAVIALGVVALFAACGGGGSSSSSTPTGSASSGPSGGGPPADALLVNAPPDSTKAVLTEAVGLAAVKHYLLTSLSMDPASFEGVIFAGDDVVWGSQPLAPAANAEAFNAAYSGQFGDPPAGVPVAAAYDAVYVTALAAVAANSPVPASIKDNMAYVANSPGDIITYGSAGFSQAKDALAIDGGDINYIGASGQVDVDASGEISKGSAQTWKVINGQIAPIETRDVDLAAESGDSVPAGELKRSTTAPATALSIGMIVTNDGAGTALSNAGHLAVNEINAAGGVFGKDVVLVVKTITSGSEAETAAKSLIDESKVGAIVGPVAPEAVNGALGVAKPVGVPLMALTSAPELSALDSGGFLFRLVPSAALQMPVLANLALEDHVTSVCVVYANGTAGETLASAFEKAMQFKKATVRAKQGFDPASGDYKTLLQNCIGS